LLTTSERDTIEQHIRKIELDVMKQYDIFVCTVSSLVDVRTTHFTKSCSISTLIVDEAGQLTQPATIMLAQLNPKRVVMFGDHLQLQPTLLSYSAEIAGLKMSQMEWTSHVKYKIAQTITYSSMKLFP
jgi:ATP-dependent RNA/DNA helicase IGHMBP2